MTDTFREGVKQNCPRAAVAHHTKHRSPVSFQWLFCCSFRSCYGCCCKSASRRTTTKYGTLFELSLIFSYHIIRPISFACVCMVMIMICFVHLRLFPSIKTTFFFLLLQHVRLFVMFVFFYFFVLLTSLFLNSNIFNELTLFFFVRCCCSFCSLLSYRCETDATLGWLYETKQKMEILLRFSFSQRQEKPELSEISRKLCSLAVWLVQNDC
jgi:hypothetical protein